MKYAKCIAPIGNLTKDRIYTIQAVHGKDHKWLAIIDDEGNCATYDSARFSLIPTPKGSPDFAQMQQIADNVKITQQHEAAIACPVVEETTKREQLTTPKLCKNYNSCQQPAEAERYEFCYNCWWAQDPRNPNKAVSLTVEQLQFFIDNQPIASPSVSLTVDPREGDLHLQLMARRESALEDSDANLAALLYRADAYILELEEKLDKLSQV